VTGEPRHPEPATPAGEPRHPEAATPAGEPAPAEATADPDPAPAGSPPTESAERDRAAADATEPGQAAGDATDAADVPDGVTPAEPAPPGAPTGRDLPEAVGPTAGAERSTDGLTDRSTDPGAVPALALPTRDDPVAAASSGWLGGPAGRRAMARAGWWTPLRVALAVACTVLALGVLVDAPCRELGWADRGDATLWTAQCYSDVPFLYRERGLADDAVAYRDVRLEYPVLTGLVMQASAEFVHFLRGLVGGDPADVARADGVRFYDVTAALMGVAALVAVVATARTVTRRPWDGLLVAASPVLLLTSTINWDLLPVALTATALLAWTRGHPATAGILLGLGAAAKLYPALLLGALLLVVWRADSRRAALRRWAVCAVAAVASWLAINVPVALWAPQGWSFFWSFNADRGADFGSPWYALGLLGAGIPAGWLNLVAALVTVALLVLVAVVALRAPVPPRPAQVAFLVVAAFVVANKVWSPQYALWLLPLAVLARPRWRDLLVWQAGEVAHFVAVWFFVAGRVATSEPLLGDAAYAAAVAVRMATLGWLAAMVVRDLLRPERDPVRPYLGPYAAPVRRRRPRPSTTAVAEAS
jgi:uncharacterized membrane protein